MSGHGRDDVDGFEADGDHAPDEIDDIAFVVVTIGVGGDAAALVGADLILVDHPIEGGMVAEAVVEGIGGDTGQCKRVIHDELGFVFGEAHFLNAVGKGTIRSGEPFQRVRRN